MNHVESYTHIDVCATFIYLYFWVDNLMFVQLVTSISGKIKKKKKKSLQWNWKNAHTPPEL